MELQRYKMVRSVQLVLLLICLVSIIPDVSARPSKEHRSQVRLMDQLFGRRPAAAAGRKHHSTSHQQQRRSADYEDYYDADYKRVQQCYEDEDVNELCQRCSKVTKSSLVFPMCCSNEDETRTWCNEYVYYGIQT
uniref:Secreted protein n=1 Tax=Anopheles atroparvus TaxID=41427 RepID=A0AAG5CUT1_ANOAO